MDGQIEIAYSLSGYVRVVEVAASRFFVEAQSIRGQNKSGSLVFWKKLYGVWDREKAIRLMEGYA